MYWEDRPIPLPCIPYCSRKGQIREGRREFILGLPETTIKQIHISSITNLESLVSHDNSSKKTQERTAD